ncbi:hypothetical protein E2C01_071715 [Portunus trituberculatus]|uniref:Uncharacterized protein n=1 Tax=Portunus trituberculatus TaxID=210409 RepID=A0A5B7I957_PORTR|nr:hypothetical protein [Portunus trituberculatus]
MSQSLVLPLLPQVQIHLVVLRGGTEGVLGSGARDRAMQGIRKCRRVRVLCEKFLLLAVSATTSVEYGAHREDSASVQDSGSGRGGSGGGGREDTVPRARNYGSEDSEGSEGRGKVYSNSLLCTLWYTARHAARRATLSPRSVPCRAHHRGSVAALLLPPPIKAPHATSRQANTRPGGVCTDKHQHSGTPPPDKGLGKDAPCGTLRHAACSMYPD